MQNSTSQSRTYIESSLETCLEIFEKAWSNGEPPRLPDFLPARKNGKEDDSIRFHILKELIKVDLEYRWKRAKRSQQVLSFILEDYLIQHPELFHVSEMPLDLIVEEYRVRHRWGDRPSHTGFLQRFPQHAVYLAASLQQIDVELAAEVSVDLRLEAATVNFETPACQENIALPDQISDDPIKTTHTSSGALSVPADPTKSDIPDLTIPGYEILGILGRGGMGVVYKARHFALKRLVALKMIGGGGHASPDQLARFQAEAEAVARLKHPSVVQIYDVGKHAGLPYFALEYLEGGSLEKKLAGTPQNSRAAAQLVLTLAHAVHAAHQAGLIHRDLKPANVLLGADGIPKITDFGLAKHVDSSVGQTQSGAIMGTPSYMAPEQAAGKTKEIGPATDVYALGAILYEMLTGRPPFKAATAMDTVMQVVKEEPVAPRRLNPSTPRDLETICMKCLEKSPRKRYVTAQALADDVRRFQMGEAIAARPAGRFERTVKWGKRHPTGSAVIGFCLLAMAGLIGGTYVYFTDLWATRAEALVKALASSDTANVPRILEDLEDYRSLADPLLRQLLAEASPGSREQLHARLALLPVDAGERDHLYNYLLVAHPDELPVLTRVLFPFKDEISQRLTALFSEEKGEPGQYLRAACVLAFYDPGSPQWGKIGRQIVPKLVSEPPLLVGKWGTALQPVRTHLIEPLITALRDMDRPEVQRSLAANLLAGYAADRPEVLVELITEADPGSFEIFLARLEPHRHRATTQLAKELDRQSVSKWEDGPLEATWSAPAPELVREVENAHGMCTERFILCQTLPLDRFALVAEALRQSGYRPIRCRPYRTVNGIRIAAIWNRDGLDWRLAMRLSAEEAAREDAAWRAKGFLPLDIGAYAAEPEGASAERYAVLWVRSQGKNEESRLHVGVLHAPDKHPRDFGEQAGYRPQSWQTTVDKDWQHRSSWIDWKLIAPAKSGVYCGVGRVGYENRPCVGTLQTDVGLTKLPARLTSHPSHKTPANHWLGLAKLEIRLLAKPDDVDLQLRRAELLFRLGQDGRAVDALSALIEKSPRDPHSYYFLRAQSFARAGKVVEARADVAKFMQSTRQMDARAFLDAVVCAYLGEEAEGCERLEGILAHYATSRSTHFSAACAYAVMSRLAAKRDSGAAGRYAGLAVLQLQEAIANGFSNYNRLLLGDGEFDAIRDRPGYVAFLNGPDLQRLYTTVWHADATRISRELHDLEPNLHLRRCRDLFIEGYRPAAIALVEMTPGQSLMAASVWHRPVISDVAKDLLAKRQAQAAVALIRLGEAERVWPLLRHQPEPRLRGFLMERLAVLNAAPASLVTQFSAESDPSVRRALLLSLGGFAKEKLRPPDRQCLIDQLFRVYRDDPDAGIHSAVEWLLRQRLGCGTELEKIDKEMAGQPAGQRRWAVSKHGHTMVLVPGPVKFTMGSPAQEGDRDFNESLRLTYIPRSFRIATKEVTVEQFQEFLKANPSVLHNYTKRYSPDPTGPMISVTWFEAAQYCRWLSEKEGVPRDQMCYPPVPEIQYKINLPPDFLSRTGYRLPTEAEWEYACRAGAVTSRHYGSSEELLGAYAWYQRNSADRTRPVGQLKPNDFGLFDMYGNVWEWCHDLDMVPFGDPSEESAVAAEATSAQDRVLRGGAFLSLAPNARSARHHFGRSGYRLDAVGLRIAQTIP